MKTLAVIVAVLLGSFPVRADETVPFHATIDTQVAQTGQCGTGCLQLSISGSGHGTHVGRVEIDGPSQINFGTGQQTGTSTLTAADGSTIDITFSGTFVPGTTPGDATFQGNWSATGGTGRFDDVSGGGTYHGSASGETGTLFLDGTLSNPGKKP